MLSSRLRQNIGVRVIKHNLVILFRKTLVRAWTFIKNFPTINNVSDTIYVENLNLPGAKVYLIF